MGRRVLIVDDSVTMRDMVSYTLANAGFRVLEAENGADALRILEDNVVDLIITDINMPKLNGIELTRKVRCTVNNTFVPILCLTTETGGDIKADAKTAGATGWLQKPFDPDTLVETAKKVCL